MQTLVTSYIIHTALNVINNVYLMVEEHLLTPTQYINIPYNQQIQMFQYKFYVILQNMMDILWVSMTKKTSF